MVGPSPRRALPFIFNWSFLIRVTCEITCSTSHRHFLPIDSLSTYLPAWTLKARVVEKSQLNSFNRANGSSNSVFNVVVVDKDGSQIQATFWGEAAVKWDPLIKKDAVYTWQGGRVVVANKRFNTTNHNYEISFDMNASIQQVEDDDAIRMQADFNFVSLRDIATSKKAMPFVVDLKVLVKKDGMMESIKSKKTGESIRKRQLSVVDDSGYEMALSLWNDDADIEPDVGEVIACRKVQIREYFGRAGSVQGSVLRHYNDSTLKEWWVTGQHVEVTSMGQERRRSSVGGGTHRGHMTLKQIQEDCATIVDETEVRWYSSISHPQTFHYRIQDGLCTACYDACPSCGRKLTTSFCEKCGEDRAPTPRFLIALHIGDNSAGKFNVKAFNDVAIKMLGVTPEVFASWLSSDTSKVHALLTHGALYKPMVLGLRVKKDTFKGVPRVQAAVWSAEPLSYEQDASRLLESIRRRLGSGKGTKRAGDFEDDECKRRKVEV